MVKDITAEGAYDEALKDVPYVIHVASAVPGSQAVSNRFK